MRTITLEILNDKAINLLKDLEMLKLIRFKKDKIVLHYSDNLVCKYKGAMMKQPIDEIDRQLNELRTDKINYI